jgi:3-methyladenine DNA glycosylase AlkD
MAGDSLLTRQPFRAPSPSRGNLSERIIYMNTNEIINKLQSLASPESVKGMARFGIKPENAYGICIPDLRRLAKQIGKNHTLDGKLWSSGIHEARILAGMVKDPGQVSQFQMERWVKDFDSWDVCDQCCSNLFDKTVFAYPKAASPLIEIISNIGLTGNY